MEGSIFDARRRHLEAGRSYNADIAEFVADLERLKAEGKQVRVKGYPSTSTIKMSRPDDERDRYVTVACAPLIPVEGEPEQPWERTGYIVNCGAQYGDAYFGVGSEPDGGYVTFTVSRLVELDIIGENVPTSSDVSMSSVES